MAAATTNASSTSPTLSLSADVLTGGEAVEYVCDVLKLDCSGLHVEPLVVVTSIHPTYGGVYFTQTPDVVFVNGDMKWTVPEMNTVIVHEVTHFLDYHYGITGWEDSCAVEALAYKISNLWAIEHQASPRWGWPQYYQGC